MRQVRFALRRLYGSRSFVLATVLVLGFGIGANVILFNLAYALLWRPLQFPQGERLATISSRDSQGRAFSATAISGAQAWFLATRENAFTEIGLSSSHPRIAVSRGDDTFDLAAGSVNSQYFLALGISPVAGRLFSEEEDGGVASEVRAVLLEPAWRKYFAADPAVIGKVFPAQMGTARVSLRILGVARSPAALPFVPQAELLLPIPWRTNSVGTDFGDAFYTAVLRLRAGVTMERASAEARSALAECARSSPYPPGSSDVYRAESLRTALEPPNRTAIWLLCGAAALLLVVMCANLAGLLLARAMARLQDSAVRLALGASRRHLLSENLLESMLLCLGGTSLAFALNYLARASVLKFEPDLHRLGPGMLDASPALIGFGVVVAAVVALAIAVPASWHAIRAGLGDILARSGGRRIAGGSRAVLVLVGAQLALVLTLLAVSGLLAKSFVAALRTDAGMDPSGVVAFRVSLTAPPDRVVGAASDLARQIEAIPGVRSVAFAADPAVGSAMGCTMNTRSGGFVPADPVIPFRMVGAAYFETLRARLVAGRTFSEDDVARGENRFILNETAARLLFGDANPVGRSVHIALGSLNLAVVGVVKDIRHKALDSPSGAAAYMPYHPWFPGSLSFIARTGRPSSSGN